MNSSSADTRIGHYENFPVASVLCPAHLRAPIAAIYHFARTADDIADEGDASAEQRMVDLASYRQQLVQAATSAGAVKPVSNETTGQSGDPTGTDPRWFGVFAALSRAIASHGLPLPLLHDLLDAFAQDIAKTRDHEGYANEAELRDYCRRSANPVGRLLLHLYGVRDALSLQQSDAICTALQLINFWQDPSVDIPRGRFYFTEAMRTEHGVAQADLLALKQTPEATRMVAQCVREARGLMAEGAPLVHAVPGRAGWELRLVVQGGLRILDKIVALRYATLRQRPTLRAWDFGVMAWRALWM